MKKRFLLSTILLLPFCSVTSADVSIKPLPIVYRAETFEQATYTCVIEGITVTIILLNETNCKVGVTYTDGTFKELETSYTLVDTKLSVTYAGETLDFKLNEDNTFTLWSEDGSSSFLDSLLTIKEDVESLWNSFIAPIFATISVTSVVSLIVSIVMSVINHKNNKKSTSLVNEESNKIGEIYKLYEEFKTANSTIIETFKSSNEKLLSELKEANEKIIKELNEETQLSEETKKEFETNSTALISKCAEVVEKTENLENLKVVMKDLASIISKIAQVDSTLVKEGITQDIIKLNQHINEL